MSLFDKHRERLERAVEVSRSREAWSPFIESPSRRHHPPEAHALGRAAFEARLGCDFDELDLPGQRPGAWIGEEHSPYTSEPLGVRYPEIEIEELFEGIARAWGPWRGSAPETRVGVCMEILEAWAQASFEHCYATMHTAGQGFMLAFAGSGASSLDRGLEALAAAWEAMDHMPRRARYARSFGASTEVVLEKRYRLMPVGVAVVLSCGSYPAWNAYPAIMANLATGNPVVLKPHPDTILPMAIMVARAREVIADAGFDPNLVTLACDSWEQPIAKALFAHPMSAIVDFTGGQGFGSWIERNLGASHQVYTETAGCNAVVLEAADDLDAVLEAIAHGLVLFSSQMCTAPQNIWLSRDGVLEGQTRVAPDEVVARLIAKIEHLLAEPTLAAGLCGALHSASTREAIEVLATSVGPSRVLRQGSPYAHPEFPKARTATPLLVGLEAEARALAQREHFGPMAFVITAPDRDAALAGACADAERFGAIASYAYTESPERIEAVEDAFAMAGASVGINLVGQRPINFTAAFSDYHVTGLNPAGNACLTDPAFVSRRFRVVQSKREISR